MFTSAWAFFFKRMSNVSLLVNLQIGRKGESLYFHFVLSTVLEFHNKNTSGKGENLDFS